MSYHCVVTQYIKKIKAPIGDENTKLIFPQSHTHFQIKKIKAPIGDENSIASCCVLYLRKTPIKKIKAPIGDRN